MSPSPSHLDDLRRRVRADPGSRAFLGLAEALLREGEREEALEVLDAGLAARPRDVAATVARARCLIELQRPREAWISLEPVLARDPSHLVAAKLAIELWLALGDVGRSRASLARYLPLGAADPDLVRLKARVAELEGVAGADRAPATGGAQAAAGAPATAAATSPAGAAGAADASAATSSDSVTGADTDAPFRAPAVPAAGDDDEVVTVTLGNLYLLQGHRAEAERIFRRILRADPDHRAARQGLARLLAPGGGGAAGRQDV